MYTLLLLLIYMAFISLGLPDSLLGSAWPIMHEAFSVPLSYAGLVTMIISAGTICSSLMSERLTKKFGTQIVTVCSVLLTAAALFGFSTSSAFYMLCLWAIPYGLGAGAIDVALNNYVALHYSSKHMSWLSLEYFYRQTDLSLQSLEKRGQKAAAKKYLIFICPVCLTV